MPVTNVEISKKELELVMNSEFILTKNRIIDKVYDIFGILSEDYKLYLKDNKQAFPAEVVASTPKIYRGENYKGLPYVMLDYPRVFSKEDAFAIRSFFWWGNYFSITLHLSGRFLEQYKSSLLNNLLTASNDYFVCINDTQWEHHFETSNYNALKDVDINTELKRRTFFKLAKKLSFTEWNAAMNFFKINFKDLLDLVQAINYRGGGKVL